MFKLSQCTVRPAVYTKARPKQLTKYSVIYIYIKSEQMDLSRKKKGFTTVKVVAGESDGGKKNGTLALRNLLGVRGKSKLPNTSLDYRVCVCKLKSSQ